MICCCIEEFKLDKQERKKNRLKLEWQEALLFLGPAVIEQVASNKSSLLLKVQMQNTQTLKLFRETIKIKNLQVLIKNAKLGGLGLDLLV